MPGDAQDHREAAGHEQDDHVAGEHVGEETNGERDDPHQVRHDLEQKMKHGHAAGDAGRDQALEVPEGALGPDALDRVGDEHDQRQHQRHRDVGGRRVDRERRDVEPEDVERVVAGRQRDEPDQVVEPDEEEEGADEREPLRRHLVVHVPARDVVAHQAVERLDRGLDPVRPGLHPAGDVDHRDAGQEPRQHQVEHGLVDVQRARAGRSTCAARTPPPARTPRCGRRSRRRRRPGPPAARSAAPAPRRIFRVWLMSGECSSPRGAGPGTWRDRS